MRGISYANRFFVDTSAWISLIVARDPHHGAVATAWRELLAKGARPVTTGDVLAETITFLRYRASHEAAVEFRRLVDGAERDGRLAVKWVDKVLFERAWRIFLDYEDQELSMADCTSFAVCRRERLRNALTLDKHFRTMGLAVLPAQ